MEAQTASEIVSNHSSVTLANNNLLENTDLVFANDVLTESDERIEDGTTYITVPLHFLQSTSISEASTIQDNLILKTLGGDAILIDASQFALLAGGTSQYVLNSADLSDEQTNQIVLSDEILSKDKLVSRNEILSELGIGIDLSSLGAPEDILSVHINEGSHVQSSGNSNLTLNLANAISSQFSESLVPEPRVKRGPGRPRRDEAEVEPPIGKGPYCCEICGKEFVKWSQMKKHVKLHSDDKPYPCPKCSASFNVESNLILHMVTHDTDNPTCPECKKKFSRMASLKAHIMLHEKEESLFCPECAEEFSTQSQLDAHAREHEDEGTRLPAPKLSHCRHCHQAFARASLLREHMREHYKVKASLSHKSHKRNIDRSAFVHRCDMCSKSFQKPSQLVRHRRIHTGEKPYKCDLCSRAFNQKGSLQIHMSKHNGIKPFRCDFCAAAFSQKGNLRAHILRVHTIPHSGEQVYKCSECTCVFKKLGSLNAHMSRMHYTADGQKGNSDSSTRQGFITVNINSLMSNLSDGQDHKNRNLESDSDILQQALVNSGLSGKPQDPNADPLKIEGIPRRNQSLPEAFSPSTGHPHPPAVTAGELPDASISSGISKTSKSKASTTVVALAEKALDGSVRRYYIRQRRVGNIRWHQCSYCIKEFKKPSDLVRHIRIHTHERPYKCTHCFRSFAVKSALTAHIRTHTGIKDYMCSVCSKKFSSASSLKVHKRLHTGTKPFPCPHCNMTFRTAGHRKSHVLSHIRDSVENSEARRKQRANKIDLSTLPAVTLQEPIIITENGLVQACLPPNGQVYMTGPAAAADRPHKCGTCGAAFRKADHLRQHTRTVHASARPFKCLQCDKCFLSKSVLRAHYRTHEGVKAHACGACGALFGTQGSLRRHQATHSTARPVLCPYCHKAFKTKVNCRRHMRTHRHELALQQAALQKNEKSIKIDPGLTMNTSVFASSLAEEYPQAFSDQTFSLPRTQQEQAGTDYSQNTIMQTLTAGELGRAAGLRSVQEVITQTLHADASGTITLPSLAGQHALTQENINEIERTLNEQIFGPSESSLVSGTTSGSVHGVSDLHSRGAATGDLEASSTDDLSRTFASASVDASQTETMMPEFVLCGDQSENKVGKGDANGIFAATFGTQSFDNCVFSSVSLQADLESLTQNASIASNIANILPTSEGGNADSALGDALHSSLQSTATIRLTTRDIISKMSGSDLLNSRSQEMMNTNEEEAEGEEVVGTEGGMCEGKDAGEEEEMPHFEELEDEPAEEVLVCTSAGRGGRRHYKCEICKQSFKKNCLLKAHLRSHTSEKLYPCSICNVRCGSPNALKAHLKLHSGEKDFQCPICESRFSTNDSFTCHMAKHSDVRPFKCSVCFVQFRADTSYNQIRKHMRIHELREKKGEVVTAVSAEPRSRRRAAVIQLSPEETQVLAQQSIESASTVSEKVLISSAAEKDRISELKDPEEQFRGEPLFANQCAHCPKSFRKPSDLVRHERIHTGERPFQCACCSKRFTVKSTLDSHLKTHSGQKLCACHVCSRLFATKGSLKVHMRLHTGAKPFKCPKCELRFRTSGHRKAHLLSHMKEGSHSSKARKRRLLSAAASQAAASEAQQTLQVAETQLSAMPQITLDATALGNLLPLSTTSDALNTTSLLTNSADNGSVVNNLQFQIADGFQIAGIDSSGALLTTQSLQLDENLLQQLQQTSNIIIQTSVPSVITDNLSENVDNPNSSALGSMPPIQYEVHTDESGQIINITPTTEHMGSENVIFNVGNELGMQVIDSSEAALTLTDPPLQSKFRVTDSLKGGRSLIALNDCLEKKQEAENTLEVEDDFLVFHDCEACGKRFSKPSQLQRHIRIHTGERPFECHLCLKRFNQKNALNTHIKSHTGERPYPCPHCDYSFTQKGNLKTHLRRAHRFSSLEFIKSSTTPSKSVLKIKQPTLTVCNTEIGNSLEQVVCDLFPQMRNTSLAE